MRRRKKPTGPTVKQQLAEAQERIAGLESKLFDVLHPPIDPKTISVVNGCADNAKPAENPKGAAGAKKVPLRLFPSIGSILGALACEDGANKYGVNNWRVAPIRLTDYISALERHIACIKDGDDIDGKSGLPHLAHIIASATIVADAGECGMLIDDRLHAVGIATRMLDKYQRRD